MTVEQLIAILSKMPKGAEVLMRTYGAFPLVEINSVNNHGASVWLAEKVEREEVAK